jgi:hypothetical protein
MLQREDNTPGEAYHIMDGSTDLSRQRLSSLLRSAGL